ncbi:hypothetical protein E2C01_038569 [Portunus trituberculatus]|uniref:Uncharacterized protein n=1 Tax=Portunus trituberculatus TaxID=210409 RepID=A0A5B7FIW4_PORTR|nr:hypothetical protein [Portunus trituberculatus]
MLGARVSLYQRDIQCAGRPVSGGEGCPQDSCMPRRYGGDEWWRQEDGARRCVAVAAVVVVVVIVVEVMVVVRNRCRGEHLRIIEARLTDTPRPAHVTSSPRQHASTPH